MELPPFRVVLAASLALRLGIIALVDWLELPGSHVAPTYTDIDYHVFTDAGALFLNGASPYQRTTFRYPPLLAWVGSLNHLVHRSTAKMLFALVDVAAGWIMHRILVLLASNSCEGNSPRNGRSSVRIPMSRIAASSQQSAFFAVGLGWLFNPMVINISTRGSADTLPGALTVVSIFGILSVARYLQQQQELEAHRMDQSEHTGNPQNENQLDRSNGGVHLRRLDADWCWGCGLPLLLSGVVQGVAVHVKLYPVIHLPGLVYFLGPCLANARVAHPPLRKWLPAVLTTEAVLWLVAFVMSLSLATALSYAYYGDSFLDAALLYHLQRADHRHNYAVWWYPLYLTFGREDEESLGSGGSLAGWRRVLSLAAMMPPLLFVLLAPFGLFRVRSASKSAARSCESDESYTWSSGENTNYTNLDAKKVTNVLRSSAVLTAQSRRLPLCLFVTTAVFVHANKVLTAQYFIWYLALLPLIAGRLRPGLDQIRSLDSNDSSITSTISNENGSSIGSSTTAQVVASALGTWLICMLFWLMTAYRLEFLGHNAWTTLWVASLAFYASSMACICVVIRIFDDGFMKDESTTSTATVGLHASPLDLQKSSHTKKSN